MATLIEAPERELQDYISEISERAHVRAAAPLSFGTQDTEGGVNFAIFSRDASRVRLELFVHAEDDRRVNGDRPRRGTHHGQSTAWPTRPSSSGTTTIT
jgi:hypothetical protein